MDPCIFKPTMDNPMTALVVGILVAIGATLVITAGVGGKGLGAWLLRRRVQVTCNRCGTPVRKMEARKQEIEGSQSCVYYHPAGKCPAASYPLPIGEQKQIPKDAEKPTSETILAGEPRGSARGSG